MFGGRCRQEDPVARDHVVPGCDCGMFLHTTPGTDMREQSGVKISEDILLLTTDRVIITFNVYRVGNQFIFERLI